MAQPRRGAIKPLSMPTLLTSSSSLLLPAPLSRGSQAHFVCFNYFPKCKCTFLHNCCTRGVGETQVGSLGWEKEENWLSIPGKPSVEEKPSASSSSEVINRWCTLHHPLSILRVAEAWEVLMLPRDINHTLWDGRGSGRKQRRGREEGGKAEEEEHGQNKRGRKKEKCQSRMKKDAPVDTDDYFLPLTISKAKDYWLTINFRKNITSTSWWSKGRKQLLF